MEGRQANFTNNGKNMTEEAMPLSNQMTGQMVNHPSAKQLVFVKQKKVQKEDVYRSCHCFTSCSNNKSWIFLFSSKGTNLGGLWVNSNNTALVYDLNGKKSKLVVGYREEEIKEISIGQKIRQKFETSLEDVSDSKLKTIADFDKKYQLQTKEVVLVKTERGWLL